MNWKLRLQNKTTLITLIAAGVSLIYQVLAMANILPPVSEDEVMTLAGVAVNILCLLGIVVDPTTNGIGDSERALSYIAPGKEGDEDS